MQEVRRAEDELGPGQKAGQGVQAPLEPPEIEEKPPEKGVQRDAPVDGLCQGKHEVEDIQGVQKRRLEPGQKRRPAVDVWVPEGKVSPGDLPEAEAPPVHELRGQISLHAGEHRVAGKEQHVEEHGERERQEAQRADMKLFTPSLYTSNLWQAVDPGASCTAFC